MADRKNRLDPAIDNPEYGNGKGAASNASGPTGETNNDNSEWFQIVFSVPWVVHHVSGPQDAINIAVSEVGKRTTLTGNRTRNVDISVQQIGCSGCETTSDALLLVSETALVGLILTLEAEGADYETAEAVARREIGPHLPDTPLTTVENPAQ